MPNQTPESVIEEVLDEERYYDRDQISNESRAAEIVAALRAANMLRDDAWLTEYTRVKQAEAWERAWREIRSIPRWWNAEDQYGEFDMQPLGPNETTEQGAYMAVREVMTNNPYRKGKNNE